MVDEMKRKNLKPTEIRFTLKDAKAGASGGTIASVMNLMATSTNEMLSDSTNPYYLNPKDSITKKPITATDAGVSKLNRDFMSYEYDNIDKTWLGPWVMQSVNTRIVHRSNALNQWKYGQNLIYREFTACKSFFGAFMMSISFPLVGALIYFRFTRNLLKMVLPKPGEGPSQDILDNGYTRISFWGKGINEMTNKEEMVYGGMDSYKADGGYR